MLNSWSKQFSDAYFKFSMVNDDKNLCSYRDSYKFIQMMKNDAKLFLTIIQDSYNSWNYILAI